MKTVTIIYTCDAWHSHNSKSILGVFTTKEKAINAISRHNNKLTISDISALSAFNQTQGLEENYLLDSATLNPTL